MNKEDEIRYLIAPSLANASLKRAVQSVDQNNKAVETDFEEKLQKKTRTSGCAVGTVFGDMIEGVEGLKRPPAPLQTSWLYSLADKINRIASLYATGRLTSEMVIKTALMGIPVLASRSGFAAWGVEIAQQIGLTLIGRMRGQRFQCLSGSDRLVWDADILSVSDENSKHRRKSAGAE